MTTPMTAPGALPEDLVCIECGIADADVRNRAGVVKHYSTVDCWFARKDQEIARLKHDRDRLAGDAARWQALLPFLSVQAAGPEELWELVINEEVGVFDENQLTVAQLVERIAIDAARRTAGSE